MKFNGLTSLLYICSLVGVASSHNLHSAELDTLAPQSVVKSALDKVNDVSTNNDADIAELRAKLALFRNMKATFSQTIYDLQGIELQAATGDIVLTKPQKLRWEVTSPDESLLIADGKTVYNVDPFLEQVTLLDQASMTASNPLMLLISDDQSQWDNVEIEKVDGDFVIRSLDENASVSLVILSFDSQQRLSLLTSIDKQQQRNVIEFTNVKLDAPLNSDTFSYVADNAWVVDDQRAIP